jgi:hypothetical protein
MGASMPSRALSRQLLPTACLVIAVAGLSTHTYAQPYTTVINVPPDIAPAWIDSDTLLNLADGGIIEDYGFDAGAADGSSTNVGVNITGGSIGQGFDAYAGSTVNQSGGSIDWWFRAHPGSTLIQSGGTIGPISTIEAGASAQLSGGRIGWRFSAEAGSSLDLVGGEFLADGVPVAGLVNPGDTVALNVPQDVLFTGTLSDGSVFVFDTSNFHDLIADGVLTLTRTALSSKPTVIDSSLEPVPAGLRTGQTLNLNTGATLGDYFAAVGATLNIDGGTIGEGLEVVDSTVNMTAGSIGEKFTFKAYSGSTVNITGGTIGGDLHTFGGSLANINGSASIETVLAGPDSTVNMSGGAAERMSVSEGGTFNYNGGILLRRMSTWAGSSMNITGGEFELDGVPVAGLLAHGDSVEVDVPEGSVLTGTLADGTVVVLTDLKRDYNERDFLSDGTINLIAAPLPAITPVINVPANPDPRQLREGQTLYLGVGGNLADRFTSVNGVMVLDAGTVGDRAEVVGSTVTINGAAVGADFDVKLNSTVYLQDGEIGERLAITSGSTVHVTGGSIGELIRVGHSPTSRPDPLYSSPATLNISGGTVGRGINVFAYSTLNITGGSVDYGVSAQEEGTVTISGGVVGDYMDAYPGSTVTISGGTIGTSFSVWEDSAVTISGGSVSGMSVKPGAHVDVTGGTHGGFGTNASTIVMSGGEVQELYSNDNSSVQILDGEIGTCRVNDSTVDLMGGTLDEATISGGRLNLSGDAQVGSISMLYGTVSVDGGKVNGAASVGSGWLNVSGGEIAGDVSINWNGNYNVSGGTLTGITTLWPGAEFTLSGGQVTGGIQALTDAYMEVRGTSFFLDGVDLGAGMALGESMAISSRDVILEGLLADGSSFNFDLDTDDHTSSEFFSSGMVLRIVMERPRGDLDQDGYVGLDDLNIVLDMWNQDVDPGVLLSGDPSGDGYVGLEDLNIVLKTWNAGTPPTPIGGYTPPVVTPEPTSVGVMAIGGMLLLRRRA